MVTLLTSQVLRVKTIYTPSRLTKITIFVRYLRILLSWLSLGHDSDTKLEITTLHNGMILSTLSISSHGFALGFLKRPRTNGDVFLYLQTHDHSLN